MPSTQQIISKLCEVEVLVSQGKSVTELAISITVATYHRRRKEYRGLEVD